MRRSTEQKQYDVVGLRYIEAQRRRLAVMRNDEFADLLLNTTNVRDYILDGRIFDLACGFGAIMRMCLALGAKEVWGIDESAVMLEAAAATGLPRSRLILGDMTDETCYHTALLGTCDAVVSRNGIHYAAKPAEVCRNAAKLLRPGGILLVVVPHPFYVQTLAPGKPRATVMAPLYDDDSLQVEYYAHDFDSYFSAAFFSQFFLRYVWEFGEKPTESGLVLPSSLAFLAELHPSRK